MQNAAIPNKMANEIIPILIYPYSTLPFGITFCTFPKFPLKPIRDFGLSNVMMYPWKNMSPRRRMEPTEPKVPKLYVQMVFVNCPVY